MSARTITLWRLITLTAVIAVVVVGVFIAIPTVHAQDGAFTNPLNTPNPLTSKNTGEALAAAVQPWARIVRAIVGLLGTLMFAMLLWGGFQYMTAAGDPEKAGAGLKTVLWAALGGGVILASYVLAAWLVSPLGNIFGLNAGLSSGSSAGRNTGGRDGETFACCKFTIDNATRCKDISYATTKDCNSTSPFWTPNSVMVITGFSPSSNTPTASQNTTVQEFPGKRCADISACSGSITEPTGCCRATKALWGGLRCKDGLTQSECLDSTANGITPEWDQQACSAFPTECRTWNGCCQYVKDGTKMRCVPIVYDGTGLEQLCRGELSQNSSLHGYTFRSTLNATCAERSAECSDLVASTTQQGDGLTGTDPSVLTAQKCCIPDYNSWSVSNRDVCYPPIMNASGEPECQYGWTFRNQPCSAFATTSCPTSQPNPPLEKSGCCYWRATPGVTPTCEQRISESLCNQDHRDLPKEDVWFIERGAILELCTPKPGGVQCVSGTGSTL